MNPTFFSSLKSGEMAGSGILALPNGVANASKQNYYFENFKLKSEKF